MSHHALGPDEASRVLRRAGLEPEGARAPMRTRAGASAWLTETLRGPCWVAPVPFEGAATALLATERARSSARVVPCQRLEGEQVLVHGPIAGRPVGQALAEDPSRGLIFARQAGDALAALHRTPAGQFGELHGHAAEGYAEQATYGAWLLMRAHRLHARSVAVGTDLGAWSEALVGLVAKARPALDGVTRFALVHGSMGPDVGWWDADGALWLHGWEGACISEPLADLAPLFLLSAEASAAFLAGYGTHAPDPLDDKFRAHVALYLLEHLAAAGHAAHPVIEVTGIGEAVARLLGRQRPAQLPSVRGEAIALSRLPDLAPATVRAWSASASETLVRGQAMRPHPTTLPTARATPWTHSDREALLATLDEGGGRFTVGTLSALALVGLVLDLDERLDGTLPATAWGAARAHVAAVAGEDTTVPGHRTLLLLSLPALVTCRRVGTQATVERDIRRALADLARLVPQLGDAPDLRPHKDSDLLTYLEEPEVGPAVAVLVWSAARLHELQDYPVGLLRVLDAASRAARGSGRSADLALWT